MTSTLAFWTAHFFVHTCKLKKKTQKNYGISQGEHLLVRWNFPLSIFSASHIIDK